MSEQDHQASDKPKHARATQVTRRSSRKNSHQATPASPPEQEVAAPDTTGSAAPQALSDAKAPAQPVPDEPSIGEKWGEFPPVERQAELG